MTYDFLLCACTVFECCYAQVWTGVLLNQTYQINYFNILELTYLKKLSNGIQNYYKMSNQTLTLVLLNCSVIH